MASKPDTVMTHEERQQRAERIAFEYMSGKYTREQLAVKHNLSAARIYAITCNIKATPRKRGGK